ncbi:MAG TPA: aminomethyl-transferring glycine dehydrogenase subunit GcvPB, partial [Erysipelothrix sp.]|nr:aminomethyl-transferring glycine dehydrogenase subunit GcvPB [Erysipelothrix sp.]
MLIYEKSFVGKNQFSLPATNVETITFSQPRQDSLELAEVAEFEVVRHYTGLAKKTYSIDEGFYPLGSCTMKYNPKLHEDVASLAGF